MLNFHVITLFPDILENCFYQSITGRASERKLISLNCVQLRDYAINDYGSVDDTLYGGGRGMLIRPEPVADAFSALIDGWSEERIAQAKRLYLSPKGQTFNQSRAAKLAKYQDVILLCGHYEGVDYRVLEALQFEEISIGDFILTGGEIPAALIIDAVARLVPDVLPDQDAYTEESFHLNLLEEKQYTRPAQWGDLSVPDILQSGDQAKIKNFRRASRLTETLTKRPELLAQAELTAEDFSLLLNNL